MDCSIFGATPLKRVFESVIVFISVFIEELRERQTFTIQSIPIELLETDKVWE
jgi:hypothetical protein